MRVLLVEDDRMIAEAVIRALKDEAYAVDWVRDGESAVDALRTGEYDLAVLDLGLPRLDGLEVLKHLNCLGRDTAVLIVTARDGLDDRIRGLDLGADDYMVKPFAAAELLARMRAVIRRKAGRTSPVLGNGILTLNPATKEICRGKLRWRLSRREFALLHALMIRPGAILSRDELESRIYGWNEEVESNAIEFLIHSVRRKLGHDAIKNVRGLGWFVDQMG